MNLSVHEKYYRYCPQCKQSLKQKLFDGRERLHCPKCDFIFWNNPKPVVSIILHKQGKALMLQRAKEPLKNYWCLPGGYINYEETPEQAIIRETKEELGVNIKINKLVGVYRIDNDPRGVNIDIIYDGIFMDDYVLSDEHKSIAYFYPKNLPAKIAYKHREAIAEWNKS